MRGDRCASYRDDAEYRDAERIEREYFRVPDVERYSTGGIFNRGGDVQLNGGDVRKNVPTLLRRAADKMN